jgi:taurine--2-oxoglutarate transaminase
VELTRKEGERVPFGERKDKISMGKTVVDEVSGHAWSNGMHLANMINTLIIAPPVVIDEDEVDEAVAILDEALRVSDDAMEH